MMLFVLSSITYMVRYVQYASKYCHLVYRRLTTTYTSYLVLEQLRAILSWKTQLHSSTWGEMGGFLVYLLYSSPATFRSGSVLPLLRDFQAKYSYLCIHSLLLELRGLGWSRILTQINLVVFYPLLSLELGMMASATDLGNVMNDTDSESPQAHSEGEAGGQLDQLEVDEVDDSDVSVYFGSTAMGFMATLVSSVPAIFIQSHCFMVVSSRDFTLPPIPSPETKLFRFCEPDVAIATL